MSNTTTSTNLTPKIGLTVNELSMLDSVRMGYAPGKAVCEESKSGGAISAEEIQNGTLITISVTGSGANPDDILMVFIDNVLVDSHKLVASEISNTTGGTTGDGVAKVIISAEILKALSQGPHYVTSRIAYANGTFSDVSTAVGLLNIDTIGPDAPVAPVATDDVGQAQGTIAQGAITDDAKPVISGTIAAANNTIQVFDNGVSLGKATVNALTGKWMLEPATALTDGPHAITIIEYDRAGNPSPVSAPLNFMVDTGTASVVINNATDNAGDIQGNVANGGVTDDTTPTLVGTAKADAVVTISEGNTVLGTTTANSLGQWSFTPTGAQSQGAHTYTASMTVAGNTITSTDFVITVDTTAPDVVVTPVGDNLKTAAEATDAAGVMTVKSEVDAVSTVTFVGQSGTVIKTIVNNGTAKPVVLTATELTQLGDGAVEVTTVTKDKAGNSITTPDGNDGDFTLDTKPPVAVADSNTGTEDVATLTGNVSTNDTAKDGSESYALVGSATGLYGTLTLNANGSYSYARTANLDAIQTTAVDTFTYQVTDAAGNSTTSTLTLNMTPVNDAAVIGGVSTGAVTEAGGVANAIAGTPTASGTLTSTDVDGTPNAFTAVTNSTTSTSGYGAFTMTAGGVWTYTLDNNNATVQGLKNGTTLTDTFTVTALDNTPKVVTVTITGSNDAAVISGATTGAITEGVATTTGTLTSTDVDGTANVFTPITAGAATIGGYGTYALSPAGVWTYTLNNTNPTVQALGQGATLNDTFSVAAEDGTTKLVTVTITGTNTAAVISGTTTGAVTEAGGVANAIAGTPTATGTLTSTDVDGTPNAFTPVTASTTSTSGYGAFTMTAGGVWTYTLDNNNATVQGLKNGTTLTDTFTVTALDNTPKVVTVTITGANDAAVISGISTGAVTEAGGVANAIAGTPIATGTLTSTDVDGTPNAFTAVTTSTTSTGGYGAFTMTAGGVWTYTLNNNNATVQALAAGVTLNDTFTVAAADGTPKLITVTITGANDTAVIAGSSTGAVTEDATANTASGTLTVTDVDAGQAALQTPASLVGTYGTYTLDTTTGAWGYTLDNTKASVQALAAGQQVTDTLVVKSQDGTATKNVVVTVTGVNDAPVIVTPTNALTTVEDTATTFVIATQLAGKVTDAEGTALKGIVIVQNTTPSGTWAYSTDGTTWVDFPTTYLGTVDWTKVMYLNASDSLRYTPAANANGASLADLNFRAVDATFPNTASGTQVSVISTIGGTGAVSNQPGHFTVSVTAVNDAAVAVADTASIGEAGGVTNLTPGTALASTTTGFSTLNVLANDTDVDNATSTLVVKDILKGTTGTATAVATSSTSTSNGTSVVGSYGTLVIGADGSYTYSVDNNNANVQALNVGGSVNDVFTYTVKDPGGLTSTTTLTVTVNGANDAPIVANLIADTTGTVGTALSYTVPANAFTDVDNASLSYTFAVVDANGIALTTQPTWLSFNATTRTFTGTPPASTGTVHVKMTATDSGNLSASDTFDIVVTSPDNIAPTLVGSNPSDNGYMMAVGNNIILNFSEAIKQGTGLIQLFKADGTLVQSFDAATSTALTWSGNNLTINPTANLLANTGYYIKVAPTAVKDLAGNAYAGIADATTLNFTTADGSGAIVVPVNGIMAIEDLSTIGDFNGDGYDDFIVGAGMNGLSSTGGAAFVVYGNANGTVPNLSAGSIAASAGFKIVSGQTGDYFGIAVNSAGDTNGDGLADLVVTAKYGDASYRESAYVVFGKSNASTVFATGLNVGTGFTANMGYQIKIDETYWGHAVSNAGDVNGDGLSDLLVTTDANTGREVFVIYGKTGNQSVTLTSYTQFTPDLGYNVLSAHVTDLGQSAYGAGDVNGDGLADFIVSAPNNTTDARGMVYVVYGNSTGTSVQLNATNGIAASQGFRILGDTGNNSSYSRFGFAVSSAGDVNGDGLADVMISSPYQPGVVGGAVYVVYGNSSGTVLDMDLRSSSGLLDASRGFRISSSLAGDHLGPYGKDIASAGDINGDGLSDMIISGRDDNGNTTASTYVVYGNASGTNVAIDASGNIAASNGFKLKGAVGFAVASAGDINGDGLNDLLVSARLGGISGSYNVVLGGTQWVTAALDGAGTFAGTSGSEALIGSAGNDTITGGGGVDRFFAGRGDDTIVLTASDIANLQNNSTGQTAKTTVSGGTGFDTIRLSGGASLDLLKVSNAAAMGIDETSRIEGIERIDMATDTAANVLNISNKDVNDMAGFNQIHTGSASVDGKTWTNVSGSALSNITSYHQMVVDGGSTDTVALTANGGAWSNVGVVSNGTSQFTVYQNTATNSQLLVQQGVTVDTQAPTLLWSTPADNDYVNTANLGNNITLQFSENVVKGNGFIQLWNKTTGQPVQAFDVSSSTLVTGWGTSTLTINPTANLAAATDYFIKISDNAIQDNSGLAYSGMNSDLQLNFSTQSADNSYAVPSSFTSASSTSSYLRSVAIAGDFNGDGYDDLLVGVAGSNESGVYVIYGNALGEGLNLDKDPVMSNGVIAADQGFKIHGADYLGTSVSGIGDVNGDGFADVLISAPSDSQGGTNAGAAFVVYGSAAPAALNLSSGTIAAARGFKIVAGAGYGSMGDSVAGVGDVNGDGIGDFVIGYAGANAGAGNGAAYVVYGKTNATSLTLGTDGSIAAADGFRLTGGVNENAGFSVSGAGDVNGDGLADVIVSANGALSNADGATYVIFGGATGGDMNALVTAGKGFKVTGLTNSTGYHLGTSVSSAGDVNGDGYADLIVATDTDQSYTAAYVVYGGAAPTNVSLAASTMAAAKGFRILGSTANGAGLGQVSGAGDLNGDGFADVIVGSTNGSSYVVYGKATGAEVSVSTGTIAASQGFKLTYSTNTTSTTAQAVSFAGDFDGDGLNDLVIAEDTDFGNSQTYKIVFGGTQWLTTPVIGNGTVTGTAASEAILGSASNDTLSGGGGVDRFFAGKGNDTIVLSATDVANLADNTVAAAKASVNGGSGFDTIRMSGGASLNLSTISNAGAMGLEENSRIESIERIDMGTDASANTLTLTAKDVTDMAGFNNIHLGGTTATNADGQVWTNVTGTALSATTKFHQLVVDGSASDVANFTSEAGWANAGIVNNGTSNYTVWQNTAKNAQILVQSGVTVASPLSLALGTDTGTSASDFITKNGTMNVSLSVSTDTWSYSTDSGTTWTAGSGTSFVVGAGTYAANAVQVRENGAGGQTVAKLANALTVDMAAPTVAVTMSDVALALGEKSTVTFQFSENVANFDINDVAIQNSAGGVGAGSLSALTKVSDSKWTAVYTPTTETNTTGNNIVVALNGYNDVAGNNGASGQSTFNVDTRFSSSLTAGFYGTTSSSSSANSSVTTNAVILDYWNPAWQGDTITTYKNGSQIDSFTVSGATNSKSLGNLTASPGDTFYSTITHNGTTNNLFNMIKVNPGTAGLTRYDSPLVLDLNGDGVQTVAMVHGTAFDLQATGTAQATGWVDAHDGLLAIDLNHDGQINSGAELFGSSTLLANGQKAADGWAALAQYDSNGDGNIDAQDAAFDAFKVWQDANGNGVTDAGELRNLKDVGVTRINLGHDNTITHQNGNLLQGVSSFTTTDGKTHEVVDAWFQTVTTALDAQQDDVFDAREVLPLAKVDVAQASAPIMATTLDGDSVLRFDDVLPAPDWQAHDITSAHVSYSLNSTSALTDELMHKLAA